MADHGPAASGCRVGGGSYGKFERTRRSNDFVPAQSGAAQGTGLHVTGMLSPFKTRRMQGKIEIVPAIKINEFPLAVGILQRDTAQSLAGIQKRPDLDELTNDIGIPISGDRFLL